MMTSCCSWVPTSLVAILILLTISIASCQDADPCDDHQVLDDFRRSPLYQPQTPRDVLCDRQLNVGWYRFTIQNRSAEMPTRCASVNYCGTQAPIWLRLDDGQRLPEALQQVQLTACSSWSRHHYDEEDDSGPVSEYADCCAMKYPVSVRNCSGYFVYRLQPTEACNMAYCAQLPPASGDQVFTFDRSPEIHASAETLNCSIAFNSSSPRHESRKFRFHWIVLSGTGQQTTAQTSAEKPEHYDLLPRQKITAGHQVMCQVEVIVNEPGSPMTLMSNPSVTSAVFTAGIVISPSLDDVVRVYKNGSFVNVTLTMTVPFTCASHVSQHDCHLTVQVVQPDDGQSQPVAISQCQLSMDSTARQESQHFLVVPVTDFVRTNSPKRPTVLQLVVSSYGDAWWHGYQLPNITIQVLDVPPVQCYAFTQGHVISVTDSLDKVAQSGRYLLYKNRRQSFEVWTEYQPCYSGRKDALCICSAEVRSSSGDETFLMDRCQSVQPKRTSSNPYQMLGGKRPLPKMSLTGTVPNSRKEKFKVLESRQGKLITVVLEHGGKVRIRTEEWGMSVSVVDAGQEPEELIDTISGLCNPDNSIRFTDSIETKQKLFPISLPDEFCACRPFEDAYLSNAVVNNNLKCDPTLEDCPSTCQQPQSVVEWSTFFNYLDISDQVRLEVDDDTINSFNLIDTPQRDSASVEENDGRVQQHPPAVDLTWSSSKSSSSSGGTNLGRDIHWTVAHGRIRRDASSKLGGGGLDSWNDEEEVTLYCSNFLVNSTVALECGQYLVGNFIMKAIQICVEDVSRNEDPTWAQESLGLLEDQCEVEATYRRASDWPRNLLGRPVIPPVIVEALNCPNRCSHQGVCLPYGCVCQPGFYGSDCSLMDDTPPRVERIGSGDGLCDLRASDCRKIEIFGSGFIDSSRLNCQIQPGRYDGSSWQRGSYNNRSIPSSAQFIDHDRIICHLLVSGSNRRYVLDDVSEELHLEIRVSNDGLRYSAPTSKLTVYHSGCRSCPAKKDSWPLCGDREDVCYLDNSCYPDGEVNPHNACQSCDLDHPQSWSINPNNQPPVVSNRLKTTAYDGQMLEYVIHATDQDPLHFRLVDPLSDAQVTKEGVFRWKAVSNALSPFNHETFALTVSDQCNHPVHFHLHVDVLPCPCINGGACRNPPDDFITSNQIDPTYRCHCREGFTGPDCGIRIDFCDPNPCRDGLCLNQVDGYVCDCLPGFKGPHCDQTDDSAIENDLSPVFSKPNETSVKQDGCTIPCRNGGTCLRRNRCQCPESFVGRQCQWNAPTCHPSCLNGGHCSRRKVCSCKKGWTGTRCEIAICALPCLNGGICSSPGKCTCPDDYQGSRCQKAVCKPKCRRGGKCIGPGICLCRAGFAGSNCELRLSSSSGENKRRNRKKTNSVGKAKAIFLET